MWLLKILGYGKFWGPKKHKTVVEPVTPVDPVVPTPTPTPTPTPATKDAFPNSVHIFCEASGASDDDFFAQATGRPYKDIYFHAIRGTSGKGKTLRLVHPWYDPCQTPINIPTFVKQAKGEGCCGISVDHEGWVLSAGPEWLKALHEACHSVGMTVCIVPKFQLEHIVAAWKMSAEEAGRIISMYCDLDLEWQYLTTGTQYADSFANDTVTCQQVGLIDGSGDRYKPAAVRREWITQMRARGLSVGVFMPKDTELCAAIK